MITAKYFKYKKKYLDFKSGGTLITKVPVEIKNVNEKIGTYTGNIVEGNMQGLGLMVYVNGDQYEGNWKDNKRHGTGTMKYYYDGNSYTGNWEDDKKHATKKREIGIMNFKNGNIYKGQWENDMMHGNGELRFSNGDNYVGTFENNNRYGFGIYYYFNGTKYEGYWLDDKKDGKGILTIRTRPNEILYGNWEKDILNGTQFKIYKFRGSYFKILHNYNNSILESQESKLNDLDYDLLDDSYFDDFPKSYLIGGTRPRSSTMPVLVQQTSSCFIHAAVRTVYKFIKNCITNYFESDVFIENIDIENNEAINEWYEQNKKEKCSGYYNNFVLYVFLFKICQMKFLCTGGEPIFCIMYVFFIIEKDVYKTLGYNSINENIITDAKKLIEIFKQWYKTNDKHFIVKEIFIKNTEDILKLKDIDEKLVQFLDDNNYPVINVCFSEEWISKFEKLKKIKDEEILSELKKHACDKATSGHSMNIIKYIPSCIEDGPKLIGLNTWGISWGIDGLFELTVDNHDILPHNIVGINHDNQSILSYTSIIYII
jgi:hypothetical protein